MTCEHLHLTSREDLRLGGGIGGLGPSSSVAGVAGGKVRPVSRTYSAPLPLITGSGNPSFLQVNPPTAGKPSSGSHSPMESTNAAASGGIPYRGSASGGLLHSTTTSQLQAVIHPGSENSATFAHQDPYTIRQQIRANVIQKSKEKQKEKMMVISICF